MTTSKTPSQWLMNEFTLRKSRNPSYSMRAFAKHLGIPPGRLSELINGKRQFTSRLASQISEKLSLSPVQSEKIFSSLKGRLHSKHDFLEIEDDAFLAISDWYHFALLNLIETTDFKYDLKWIASRLGISTIETKLAVSRLIRLGLIQESDSTLIAIHANVQTTDQRQSDALRKSHKQSLEQAMQSIDDVDLDLRDISSMTMAIDTKNIPQAKKLIRNFRRRLCSLLERGNKTEVFNLNIQLVPVTKIRRNQ